MAIHILFQYLMGLGSNVCGGLFDFAEFSFCLGIDFFQIRLSMFNSRFNCRTDKCNGLVDRPWNQGWLGQRVQGSSNRGDFVLPSPDYSVILVIAGGVFEKD